jgi:hypothetical protein
MEILSVEKVRPGLAAESSRTPILRLHNASRAIGEIVAGAIRISIAAHYFRRVRFDSRQPGKWSLGVAMAFSRLT